MSLGAVTAHADIIIDNGGGGTSSTGTWAASGGTTPYGANSLWARDGATYRWQFTSQPAGTYEVFMWWSGWSSRATNVPVTIVHRDGSATVTVNQLQNAGKWNSLGQYYFNGTGSVSIRAANGSTLSTCADAVRFVNVGGGVNQPPTAVNDTAVDDGGGAGHRQRGFQRHGRRRSRCLDGCGRRRSGERHGGPERERHGDVHAQCRLHRGRTRSRTRWRTLKVRYRTRRW